MLIAFFLVSPLAIGALFAFARFADRHFRDTLALEGERLRAMYAPAKIKKRERDRDFV